MPRQGYLLVERDHPLFPSAVVEQIVADTDMICALIEEQQNIILPTVRFELKPFTLGGRSLHETTNTLFSDDHFSDVRLILSSTPLQKEGLEIAFSQSKLLILVYENVDSTASIRGGIGPAHTRYIVPRKVSTRAIQDIILDVTLGNFFAQTSPVADVISQGGLQELFKLKVKFARQLIGRGWPTAISNSARYASLSSFIDSDNSTLKARATGVFDQWIKFSTWLAPRRRTSSIDSKSSIAQLKSLRLIGGQLSLAKIEKASLRLPDGNYVLIVLRRSSSTRKSPSLRNKLESLFGARAGINSFRFMTIVDVKVKKSWLMPLVRSGHLSGISLKVDNGKIQFSLEEFL